MDSLKTIIIPVICGDGIGPEIMEATQKVIDHAVQIAYVGNRNIKWKSYSAGKTAYDQCGEWLPKETIYALRQHPVGLKGPLTTPVSGGFQSLNVVLRQALDLYVCFRQVRWFKGLPSPHHNPYGIDIVIFRENIEDIYLGIEYPADSDENRKWMAGFKHNFPDEYRLIPYPENCGVGIKVISKYGSQRLIRAALDWAIKNNRKRVTLMHKGNIMKYTEGAFLHWGYDLAETNYSELVFSERYFKKLAAEEGDARANEMKNQALADGGILLDDVIADVVFEQLITRPQNFDVIATTNLNGDYISDAAAALAGGVGISPGANFNFETGSAVFEANHGSAESLAGKNLANPSSLILSGEMMLRHLGWDEAADLVWRGMKETIRSGKVTFDLAQQIEGVQSLSTDKFTNAIIANI